VTYQHEEPLDAEQTEAVEATEKAISVLAGPGSGKTRTLAHRARHLLLGGPEDRALLLTFTNKAAAEMSSRALGVGDIGRDRLDATTFHGFGARFLRSHGTLVDIDPDFDILDEDEAEEVASQVARSLGVPNQFDAWGKTRRGMRVPGEAAAAFGAAYESAKRAEGVVDFDDLVAYPAQILGARDDVAAAYGARYRHLLIDEFQDTNPAQFAIVDALAPHLATVSVFADDDQAIMRFAGAEAANVAKFTEELGARCYPLLNNYRCREEIVVCANRLIAADPEASGRQMVAMKEEGSVEVRRYTDTAVEAGAIADEIAASINGCGMEPNEIAVLSKGGPRAREVVEALQARQVPITDWRGVAYQSAGKRNMITCFSTIRPLLRTRQASRLSELFEVDLIEERDTQKFLEAHATRPAASELIALREKALTGAPTSEVARHAQTAVLLADPDSAGDAALLVAAIEDFETYDPSFSLEDLMTELALKGGGRSPTQSGGVKVATLHATKGLQWPTVYLIGMEEGNLPYYLADEQGTVPDERRACFVGVCRAEDRLVLSGNRYFRTKRKTPSRFLAEMGLEV
jgi:DNA helicase II / ATP-dependent DNA helicase PcrA